MQPSAPPFMALPGATTSSVSTTCQASLTVYLQGVIIAGNIYQTKYLDSVDTIHGPDYGYAILLWVLLLVGVAAPPSSLFGHCSWHRPSASGCSLHVISASHCSWMSPLPGGDSSHAWGAYATLIAWPLCGTAAPASPAQLCVTTASLCLTFICGNYGSHHLSVAEHWPKLPSVPLPLIGQLHAVLPCKRPSVGPHDGPLPPLPALAAAQSRQCSFPAQLPKILLRLLQVIRALMIALFYPILRFTGYSITWQKAVVMVWSGLRGAVGLALSLFVLFNTSITDIHFRVLVFFMVSMEAAISIVVQGSSMGLLLQVGLAGRLGKVLLGFVVHRSSMCR